MQHELGHSLGYDHPTEKSGNPVRNDLKNCHPMKQQSKDTSTCRANPWINFFESQDGLLKGGGSDSDASETYDSDASDSDENYKNVVQQTSLEKYNLSEFEPTHVRNVNQYQFTINGASFFVECAQKSFANVTAIALRDGRRLVGNKQDFVCKASCSQSTLSVLEVDFSNVLEGGLCTRAVAAALKVLLREAKRLPTEGFVFVTSKNGCLLYTSDAADE